ncbi:MAG: hypothetical protein ACFB9M_08805 [Myxococcota bacterium]
MSDLQFDFVVYLGDPDDGADAVSSRDALQNAASYRSRLAWPDVYGRVVVRENGADLLNHRPDPLFSLVVGLVKALPYVIDGEPENAILTEAEQGFSIAPAGKDVLVSFFSGDPYEPEEFLLEPQTVPLGSFGSQILDMGKRLRDLMKACDPQVFERDDYSKSLLQFLEDGEERFKKYQLRLERGLRVE